MRGVQIILNFARLTRGIVYFHNGEQFDYAASLDRTCDEIARFSPEDAKGYRKLLNVSKQIFDIGFTKLADKPFTRFGAMDGTSACFIAFALLSYRLIFGRTLY